MIEAQKQVKSTEPPDNVLSLDAERHRYESDYIQRAFSVEQGGLEAPIENRCNGHYAALRAIHGVHASNGPAAAKDSARLWLPTLTPELAELIEPSQRKRLYCEDELEQPQGEKWLQVDSNIRIPAEGITLFAGPSGQGKSHLTNHFHLTTAQTNPSAYIAAEKFRLYADRRKAWYQRYQKQSKGNAYYYDGAPNLMQPEAVAALIDELRPLKPKAVFIDTLARCMLGGDENSARDMGLFVEGCETIKRELHCAVIVVHHTGKNGTSERGSSALRGACDCVIELSNEDGTIVLTNTKLSSAAEYERTYFRLETVQLGTDPDTKEPIENVVPVLTDKRSDQSGQKLTDSQHSILDALYQEVFRDSGAKFTQLKGYIGGSERTFYRSVSTLMRLGYVVKDGKYDPYRITQDGIDVLEGQNG